jgi:hypothetical protein
MEQVPISKRRDDVLKKLEKFGGIDSLIDNEDKYNVFLSKGCHELFTSKYNELFVQK